MSKFLRKRIHGWLLLAVLMLSAGGAWAQTYPSAQALPFTQEFTSLGAGTIWTAGSWNANLSDAFRGHNLGAGGSASFRTSNPTADLELLSGDASNTTGGIYNYANKIGFLNNGTSVDGSICFAVNTTGNTNVQVAYSIGTLRNPYNGTSNTRINAVTLQYFIVGTSSSWTEVPGVTQYTNNTATQTGAVTSLQNLQNISATLPVACENQANVRLRLVSKQNSGAGSRPSFAISYVEVTGNSGTPSITLTPTSPALAFGSQAQSTSSSAQTYQVSGANLTADISVTAPTHYEVATAVGGPYGSTLTLTKDGGGVVALTTIYVRFSPTTTGTLNGTLTNASTGATTKNVSLTGTGVGPTITLSPTTPSFNFGDWEEGIIPTTTQTQQYTVSGANLTGTDLLITAPVQYGISTTNTPPGSSTVSLTITSGTVAATPIYVWFAPGASTATNVYAGNITNVDNGGTAPTQNVAVTGQSVPVLSPIITSLFSLPDFGNVAYGATSAQANYNLATNYQFTNDVVVKAPDYYQVSKVNGGPYTDEVTFTPAELHNGTNPTPQNVYVVFKPLSGTNGLIGGDIVHSSTTASVSDRAISLSGTETGNIVITPISHLKSAVDANCLPTTTGSVNIKGRVYGVNIQLTSPRLQYTIIDNTGGIGLFYGGGTALVDQRTSATITSLNDGDEVIVTGTISQFNGLMQITPSAIRTTGNTLAAKTPTAVTALSEATESDFLQITGVTITDNLSTAWKGGNPYTGGGTGFNINGTANGVPVVLRITGDVKLFTAAQVFGTPFKTSDITVIGLGGQFNSTTTNKCTGGYQIFPYKFDALFPLDPTKTHIITGCTAPTIVQTVNTLSFPTTEESTQSASQSYQISGGCLTASAILTVSASANYEVSNDNIAWGATTTYTSDAGGNIGSSTVYVRFSPGTTGVLTGTLTYSGAGYSGSQQVTLSGTATLAGLPILSGNPAQFNFGSLAASAVPSSALTFTLSTTNVGNINTNITLTAPLNVQWQISDDGSSWVQTYTLTSGQLPRTVYVRFNPTGAVGSKDGIINISAGSTVGATQLLYPLFGYYAGAATAYNYYRGSLHTHTSYSDGTKDASTSGVSTPAQAYAYADVSTNMEFMGIAEHNHSAAGMSKPNYSLGWNQANTYNGGSPVTTNSFTALYGMEWGTISSGGHFTIYGGGADQLVGWEAGNYDVLVNKGDYTGASGLLNTMRTLASTAPTLSDRMYGFMCHPNSTDYGNLAGTAFNSGFDEILVGCAVRSGPAFSTTTNYTDPPGSDYSNYFNTMLGKGYHLAPNIDFDSHNTTFGRATQGRTFVLATSLSATSMMDAFKARRFYASEDWNANVDYQINGSVMGSRITAAGAPNLSIKIDDGDVEASSSIAIISGTPGGGTPSAIQTFTTSTPNNTVVTYSDASIPNNQTRFYYALITQADGNKIWTAPIWFTRDDSQSPLPVRFIAFNGVPENNGVMLRWSTASEINNDRFEIERSTDRVTFTKIGAQIGNGTTNNVSQYSYFDGSLPVAPKLYYRLKQVDYNGEFEYSPTVEVNFTGDKDAVPAPWQLYPNPYTGSSDLQLVSIDPNVKLTDVFSYSIITQQGEVLAQGSAPLTELGNCARKAVVTAQAGVYLVKVSGKNGTFTLRLVKA